MKKTTQKSPSSTMKAPLLGLNGVETGSVDLPQALFGVQAHPTLLSQYVRMYLANNRQGTASTKDRSQIRGTTKKMYKQKGTGNARHASAKAPIFVGGGVVGGPKPRDFGLSMNKKQRVIAFAGALSVQAEKKGVQVLSEEVTEMNPKTKSLMSIISSHENKRVVLVVSPEDVSLKRSAANVPWVQLVNVRDLNTYDVLRAQALVFTHRAFSTLVKSITN